MIAYETGSKPNETRMIITPNSDFFRYFRGPTSGPAADTGARAGALIVV